MTRRTAGFVSAIASVALCLIASGCPGSGSGERGVTIPPEERHEKKPRTSVQLITSRVRNLTFEKPGRRLIAARNLGKMGADAQPAIPYLEKYSTQEQDESTGFPSEEEREAFKAALEQIRADMAAKGIAEPKFEEVPAGKPGETDAPNIPDPAAAGS